MYCGRCIIASALEHKYPKELQVGKPLEHFIEMIAFLWKTAKTHLLSLLYLFWKSEIFLLHSHGKWSLLNETSCSLTWEIHRSLNMTDSLNRPTCQSRPKAPCAVAPWAPCDGSGVLRRSAGPARWPWRSIWGWVAPPEPEVDPNYQP